MISSKIYILQLIARLNVMTVSQIQRACCNRVSRSPLYRSFKCLMEDGYITRVAHPKRAFFAFQATEKAHALVYGSGDRRIRNSRDRDLVHSVACSDAAIGLSFYPNIKALAFDDELTPEEIEKFSLNRRPDIIAQIVQGAKVREFSIEVENSLQNSAYVEGLLDTYQMSFEKGLKCTALVIVARREDIYRTYLESVSKRPKSFDLRVLVTRDLLLQSLNPTIYGIPNPTTRFRWDLVRTESESGTSYVSLESGTYGKPEGQKETPIGSHTEIYS